MKLKLRLSNQKGDTIVEVLICIAILSLILAAAYSLTTRSQAANLQAQERGIASNLVDRQLELLRGYADKYDKLPDKDYFCIKSLSGVSANDVVEITDLNAVPADCKKEPFFSSIVYSPAKAKAELGAADDTFAVRIKWDSASGGGQDEVKLFYRINTAVTNGFDPVLSPVQCADGLDNDGEGGIDVADPGCSDASDNSESPNPTPPPSTYSINVALLPRERAGTGCVTGGPIQVYVRSLTLNLRQGATVIATQTATGPDVNATFSGLAPGTYSVRLSSGTLCSSADLPRDVTISGSDEIVYLDVRN